METYQFSAIYEGSAVAFSPGSTFVATATRNTVFVRSSKSLQAVRQWDCAAGDATGAVVIDDVKWSTNGSRLLASSKQSSCAWVLDLACDNPVAFIDVALVDTDWGFDDIRVWTDAVRRPLSSTTDRSR